MTYFFKLGGQFYFLLITFTINFLVLLDRFSRDHAKVDNVAIWLYSFLLIFFVGPFLWKQLSLKIKNKVMLTVSEEYIFDHYKNRRFDWAEIEEIVVNNEALKIYLYEPKKYPLFIRSPFEKLLNAITKKIPKASKTFIIDLDMVKIPKDEYEEFVENLNDYSIKAEEIEKPSE